MRICFFYSSMQAGGAERQTAVLSNYLVAKGHDVTILTMDDKPSFYALDDKVSHVNLDLMHSSKNFIEAIVRNFSNVKKIQSELEKINPDVVICLAINYCLFASLARKKLNYKIIGYEQTNPFAVKKGFWNKSKKWISKKCDGFIFQTSGAKGFYPRKVQDRSFIMPNCIIPEQFSCEDKDWQDRVGVLAAGRMIESKCFDDLIKAFSIVHKTYPEVTLDIYGDGNKKEDLLELTKKLELDQVVNFRGKSSTMYADYASHKIFVMTSRLEGMPNVLVEALASGCACVSVNCDFGPSELIHDGENGLLVDVYDVAGVAKGIIKLLTNDEYARQLSESAKTIRETNSADVIVGNLLEYLKEVVKN